MQQHALFEVHCTLNATHLVVWANVSNDTYSIALLYRPHTLVQEGRHAARALLVLDA